MLHGTDPGNGLQPIRPATAREQARAVELAWPRIVRHVDIVICIGQKGSVRMLLWRHVARLCSCICLSIKFSRV